MLLEPISVVKQSTTRVQRPEWGINIKALGLVVKARWARSIFHSLKKNISSRQSRMDQIQPKQLCEHDVVSQFQLAQSHPTQIALTSPVQEH